MGATGAMAFDAAMATIASDAAAASVACRPVGIAGPADLARAAELCATAATGPAQPFAPVSLRILVRVSKKDAPDDPQAKRCTWSRLLPIQLGLGVQFAGESFVPCAKAHAFGFRIPPRMATAFQIVITHPSALRTPGSDAPDAIASGEPRRVLSLRLLSATTGALIPWRWPQTADLAPMSLLIFVNGEQVKPPRPATLNSWSRRAHAVIQPIDPRVFAAPGETKLDMAVAYGSPPHGGDLFLAISVDTVRSVEELVDVVRDFGPALPPVIAHPARPTVAAAAAAAAAAACAGRLTEVRDAEPELLSSCVSLQCPLDLGRLRLPAVGAQCDHISCFNLKTYLRLCWSSGLWQCPICGKPALLNDLRLSRPMQDILAVVGPSPSPSLCFSNIFCVQVLPRPRSSWTSGATCWPFRRVANAHDFLSCRSTMRRQRSDSPMFFM